MSDNRDDEAGNDGTQEWTPREWQAPSSHSGDETQVVETDATQQVSEGNPYGAPQSNPYAAPQPPPLGQNPYSASPYGDPNSPYGAPPQSYYQQQAPQQNTSALVLTIVAAIGTLTCCLPVPALILGIIALTKQTTDPENSAKLAKYGWITFGVMVVLAILAFVLYVVGIVALSSPAGF